MQIHYTFSKSFSETAQLLVNEKMKWLSNNTHLNMICMPPVNYLISLYSTNHLLSLINLLCSYPYQVYNAETRKEPLWNTSKARLNQPGYFCGLLVTCLSTMRATRLRYSLTVHYSSGCWGSQCTYRRWHTEVPLARWGIVLLPGFQKGRDIKAS
jgi:hypothetical protein